MSPDLNDTLIFVKVAENGSFTAAARALRLPKTTVSRRVRELEHHLGAQLLHRTTRQLSLTEAGLVYFKRCREIVRAVAEAESAVDQLQGTPRGTLRIASYSSLVLSVITPLLGEFRELYPEVHLDLVLSHLPVDLVDHEIDIALRLGPLPDSSLVARRLTFSADRIYASDRYLERHGEPRHPSELCRHQALATRVAERTNGYAWAMGNGGRLEDYRIKPVILADDPEALKEPLFAGVGVMIATDLIMRRHAAEGLVRPPMPGWFGRCPELYALFPRSEVQPPKRRVFIDFLLPRLDVGSLVSRTVRHSDR